jgi:hypothetical protein
MWFQFYVDIKINFISICVIIVAQWMFKRKIPFQIFHWLSMNLIKFIKYLQNKL